MRQERVEVAMPDISMCEGRDCPQKSLCYRFTAKPSEFRQSYFVEPPNEGAWCKYFWNNEGHYGKEKEKKDDSNDQR